MAEKDKKPEIRFKRFVNNWEQHELESKVEFFSGLTYSPTDVIDEGGTLVLRSSNVKNGEIVYTDNVYVNSKAVNSENVRVEDVIVVVRNGSRSLIGKHAQIKERLNNTVIGAFMTGIHSNQSAFITALLDTAQFGKEIEKNLGATINQITNGAFKKMQFMFPDYDEQKSIGIYFQHLDNLSTLHQRKYEKLVNVKKSMLEKMFPKSGADLPEIHFKGFADAWEQRELGEYAKFRRGSFPQPYGNKEWYDGDGAMPFVQVGDVTDNLSLVDDTKQKISIIAQPKSVLVEKGKVVVTLQGSIGRVAIVQYDAYVDRTLLIFEDYEKKTDTRFWAYTIQQKFDIEKKKAPGGTIKTITKDALSVFQIAMPDYEEQEKIGTIFLHLDNLITLHQRELEKLRNIKKACLEKMFV